MNTPDSRFNIAIVTFPFSDVCGEANLRNLIQILEPLSSRIITITGNFPEYPNKIVRIIRLKSLQIQWIPLPIKILNHLLVDLQISFHLLEIFRHVDIISFHIGARSYLLSTFLSKLLMKKIIVFSFSSAYKIAEINRKLETNKVVSSRLVDISEKITFLLADQIAVESKTVIKFSNLEKYKNKISIYGAKYINMNLFKIKKELKDRRERIGYIGSLHELKGICNLVNAFPLILKNHHYIKFLIGGDGPLFLEIKEMLKRSGVYRKVKLAGEIPHNEVPNYLNEMKLLILPSYTEGIPGIVQEAMACGTPVLATPVGGVPDLIKDGGTGFIMENNSPECIAKNVIKAFEHPDLEGIVKNGRKLIEDEYSYEVMVRKCKDSLDELMRGNR